MSCASGRVKRFVARESLAGSVTWIEDYFRFLAALRFVFFAAFGAAFAFLRFAIVPSN